MIFTKYLYLPPDVTLRLYPTMSVNMLAASLRTDEVCWRFCWEAVIPQNFSSQDTKLTCLRQILFYPLIQVLSLINLSSLVFSPSLANPRGRCRKTWTRWGDELPFVEPIF